MEENIDDYALRDQIWLDYRQERDADLFSTSIKMVVMIDADD